MSRNILKQIAIIAFVALHLASPYLVSRTDVHALAGRYDGRQSLRTHTCGAIEIHKPLDDFDHCLLNPIAILQSLSTLPKSYVLPLVERPLTLPSMGTTHITEPDRGPPASAA